MQQNKIVPLCQEIHYQDPLNIVYNFASNLGVVFLDSAALMPNCGRYSFIAIEPFFILQSKNAKDINPFEQLRSELKKFPLQCHEDMPPFQGGAAGYFSYDLCQHLEALPTTTDDMMFADLILGLYDLVIAFDHERQRAWVFSSGYPEQQTQKREQRAAQRCAWLCNEIKKMPTLSLTSKVVCNMKKIESNFSQPAYEHAVEIVKEFILSGDIFEANISQRFKTQLPVGLSAFDLYRRLRKINPAPFAAYLCFGDTIIASASPERFLQLKNKKVETRPIKGTRPREINAKEDAQQANALLTSEKDFAENVMIVDLLRNDLSRVCEDHSVQVPQLCGLESYATVHHLVSVVTGTLKKEYDVIDLLQATFPGGSITGAPKIRAMEIIAEVEPNQRGPYCGSIGYIGFNGDFDSSIIIRTYAIKNDQITFQAGGAVVADSNPLQEYKETLTKAKALLTALTEAV